MKSEVVNLGVIKENPGTVNGAAKIGDFLSKYIPAKPDGSPLEMATWCDQGANERMVGAKRLRATSRSKWSQLKGPVPLQGDFHKRIVILGDVMKYYFKKGHTTSRGTLGNICATQKLKSVTDKVINT